MILSVVKVEVLGEIAERIAFEVTGVEIPTISYGVGISKNCAGVTNWKTQTIKISKIYMVNYNEEDLVRFILHEIFHVLAPQQGHDGDWANYTRMYNKSSYTKKYGEIGRKTNIRKRV